MPRDRPATASVTVKSTVLGIQPAHCSEGAGPFPGNPRGATEWRLLAEALADAAHAAMIVANRNYHGSTARVAGEPPGSPRCSVRAEVPRLPVYGRPLLGEALPLSVVLKLNARSETSPLIYAGHHPRPVTMCP